MDDQGAALLLWTEVLGSDSRADRNTDRDVGDSGLGPTLFEGHGRIRRPSRVASSFLVCLAVPTCGGKYLRLDLSGVRGRHHGLPRAQDSSLNGLYHHGQYGAAQISEEERNGYQPPKHVPGNFYRVLLRRSYVP